MTPDRPSSELRGFHAFATCETSKMRTGRLKTAKTKEFSSAVARCIAAAARASLLAAASFGFVIVGAAQGRGPAPSSREDIYVLHSVREERTVESSWCTPERAGFALLTGDVLEERFGLWSVPTEPKTGRIVYPEANKVGEIRTCAAATLDPSILNFYAEGKLAQLPFTGNGDCRLVRADHPERGLTALRCYLNLRGLPSDYQGGLATSNTLVSEAVLGAETDPPGYLQTSVATFRLWKALRVGVKEGDRTRTSGDRVNGATTAPKPWSR